jgi:hypothetical protein
MGVYDRIPGTCGYIGLHCSTIITQVQGTKVLFKIKKLDPHGPVFLVDGDIFRVSSGLLWFASYRESIHLTRAKTLHKMGAFILLICYDRI